MPYKRKYRKKSKRARRKPRYMRKSLPVGGFPLKSVVKLRYVDTVTLNPGAGLQVSQVYRANSVHDPDSTGIGAQPSNFDRWTANYDRYTVLGARIKVEPLITSSTNQTPGQLVVHLSEDGTDLATAFGTGGINNLLEQPRLNAASRMIGMANAPATNTKLYSNFSAKKFFGVSKNVLMATPYSADTSASPTEQAFFEISYSTVDDSNDPGVATFRVSIDYIVAFTEPKITDAS